MDRAGTSGDSLVLLRTVPDAFGARVLAARLGADGIVTELRGGLGGPYPIGSVTVWVLRDDEEVARDLLLADEVESAFEPTPAWPRLSGVPVLFGLTLRQVFAAAVLLVIVLGIAAAAFHA